MEDEEDRDGERDGSLIPSICSLFCLCSVIGGILLFLYYFLPHYAQPWFPISAAILVASTSIFWILTCIYSCIKACCRRRFRDSQVSACETAVSAAALNISVVQNNGCGQLQGGKHKKISIASVDSYTPLRYSI